RRPGSGSAARPSGGGSRRHRSRRSAGRPARHRCRPNGPGERPFRPPRPFIVKMLARERDLAARERRKCWAIGLTCRFRLLSLMTGCGLAVNRILSYVTGVEYDRMGHMGIASEEEWAERAAAFLK